LEKAGVSFDRIVSQRPTTQKTRILSGRHYYLRIDEEVDTPLSADETALLETKIKALLAQVNLIVASDYDKGFFSAGSCAVIESLAVERGILLCGDIKPCHIRLWQHLDLLTPNKAEGQELGEALQLPAREALSPVALAEQLSRMLHCQVLLKLAQEGMAAATPSGPTCFFPALCQNPVNTSGAGDTVLATAAAALAAGASLEAAADLASHAAAIAVACEDTHVVTAAALREALSTSPG
jgi:rfaE bifunctional protein kinase chain/domain